MSKKSTSQILLLVWVAVTLLGLARFAEKVHPRYDAGAYIIAAKSVAEGKGLRHLAHPEMPPFTTYPPVIPVLLSPFAAFAKTDFVGLKIGMVLIYSLTLLAFGLTFRRYFEGHKIYFAMVLLGSGSLLAFAGRIQGEVPFTLFGLLAIFFADRWLKEYRRVDLFGMLASLSLLCNSRQAGIAWVGGILLALVLSPRNLPELKKEAILRIATGLLVLLLIAVPWIALVHAYYPGMLSPGDSSMLRADGWDPGQGQLSLASRAFLGRIKMNLVASATYVPESLFFKYKLSDWAWMKIIFWPLFAIMLIGFVRRAIAKRSAIEAITVAYCALIIVSPWLKEPRFFTVILPLLILYLADGVQTIALWASKQNAARAGQAAFAAVCVFIAVANVAAVITDDHENPWSAKNHKDYELAMFAKPYLPKDGVVLAHDHCAFYLLTGNKSLSFTKSEQKFLPQYKLDAYLARGGQVDFIAWVADDDKLVQDFLADTELVTSPVAIDEAKRFYLHAVQN